MPRIPVARLEELSARVFVSAGAPPGVARRVARGLVRANAYGIDSHGVVRVPEYVAMVKRGRVKPAAYPSVVKETAVIAVLDGNWGFGQLSADRAMELAIGKAKREGVGVATVVHCNHVGAIGEYTETAAREGLLGLAIVNGIGKYVAPHGGRSRMLSTNPIAFSVPVPGGRPILVDFATSVVAEGKVRVARNKGVKIAHGWALDSNGVSTDDPNALYAGGSLLPLGSPLAGHKGYGLSIMAEIVAGILSGSGVAALETQRGNGCFFLALDFGVFRDREAFLDDVRRFIDALRAAPPLPGVPRVLVPGDPEVAAEAQRLRDGVELDDATWQLVTEAARSVGVEP